MVLPEAWPPMKMITGTPRGALQGPVPEALAQGIEVDRRPAPRVLKGLVALGGVGAEGGQQGGQDVAIHQLALQGAGQAGVFGQGVI